MADRAKKLKKKLMTDWPKGQELRGLLGATIGCYGVSDANGRTDRVPYSNCQVRSGGASAGLTTVGEQMLHRLP